MNLFWTKSFSFVRLLLTFLKVLISSRFRWSTFVCISLAFSFMNFLISFLLNSIFSFFTWVSCVPFLSFWLGANPWWIETLVWFIYYLNGTNSYLWDLDVCSINAESISEAPFRMSFFKVLPPTLLFELPLLSSFEISRLTSIKSIP